MGKVKQNKKKMRHQPTGMISVEEAESREEAEKGSSSSMEEKTLPILEKLNSPNERAHACAALANLVLESNAIDALMKHDIVRRVAPLILDSDEKIQEAATGVLRNLTLSISPNICKQMIEQDIMTPITHYIKQFAQDCQRSTKDNNIAIEKQSSAHEQVLHLLLNLSENACEAVERINDNELVPILVTFLNMELFDLKNMMLTAQCLFTITESNPTAAAVLANSNDCMKTLENNLLGNDTIEAMLLLKVYLAGVLFNIATSLPSHVVFEMFQAIGGIFAKVLSFDIHEYMQKLTEKLNTSIECEMTENAGQQNGNGVDTESDISVNEVKNLCYLLEAQQVTLEILTNVCCCGDVEEWQDEHCSEDDINGSCDVDSSDMNPNMDDLRLNQEILSSVLSNQLPKRVVEKCSFVKLNEESMEVLRTSEGEKCLKIMATIQTRAMVCLNNMLSSIEGDQLGGINNVTLIYNEVMKIAFEHNDVMSCKFTSTDDEFVEAASGALRSTLEKLFEVKAKCVTTEHVQLLCHLCVIVSHEAAKINLMNVLGIIGKILIDLQTHDFMEALMSIGTVLRDVVTSKDGLCVIAEALDAIFDVFADSPVADIAAGQIELLATLEKVFPILKSRIKKERPRLECDQLAIINTARTNLLRFLKYKKQISV